MMCECAFMRMYRATYIFIDDLVELVDLRATASCLEEVHEVHLVQRIVYLQEVRTLCQDLKVHLEIGLLYWWLVFLGNCLQLCA